MNKKPISQLPDADELTGQEYVPVVQNGVTKKTRSGNYLGEQGPAGPTGPQGPQGPTGATGPGVASEGLRGQSLVKFSGTTNDTGWVYPSALSQPAALRRFALSFGAVRQGKLFGGGYRRTTDVMWVGDSIGEGSSSVEDSSTIVNIFTDNLSDYGNINGLSGRWVPANLNWRTTPRWQAETIGSQGTSETQGISLRGMTLSAVAGAQKGQSVLLAFTGDNVIIHYRKRKTSSTGSIRFQLQNKDGNGNWQALRTFAAIDTVETDAAVATNGHKLYAFNVASEYFNLTFEVLPRADYRIVVYQWSPTTAGTGGPVTFDGAYVCDGNTQQGIRVYNASLSGSEFATFNNTVNTTLNNDWLSALRNAIINPSLVVIALGTNETATTNSWVNGPSNADGIETKLRQMVTDITAAYAVGFPTSATPSIALLVPPAAYLDGSADWQLVRNMYQRVASELNLAIWDWAEFTGDVNFKYAFVGQLNATITASTNPVTISTPLNVAAGSTIIIDSEQMIVGSVSGSTLTISTRGANGTTATSHSANAYIYNIGVVAGTGDPQGWVSGDLNMTHPNTTAHRAIGDFATSQALNAVNAPRNMTPTIAVGDIPALSVGTAELVDGAVTSAKITSVDPTQVTGTAVVDNDPRLNQMSNLKRWHREFARVRQGLQGATPSQGTTDVLWVGDSISVGFSSNNEDSTLVNIFTDNLSRITNNGGRSGRWVPAGGEWLFNPKFSDNDSTLLAAMVLTTTHTTLTSPITTTSSPSVINVESTGDILVNSVLTVNTEKMLVTGVSGTTLTVTRGYSGTIAATALVGATVTAITNNSGDIYLNEAFSTSLFPASGSGSIVLGFVGVASIDWTGKTNVGGKTVLTGVAVKSAYFYESGSAQGSLLIGSLVRFGGNDAIRRGLSLSSRDLNPRSGENMGDHTTIEFTGDNALVHYRKRNFLSGSIKFTLEGKDQDGQYVEVFANNPISTYQNVGPDYYQTLVEWNAAEKYSELFGSVMPRADYRLKVCQWSDNPSITNYSVTFDGVYLCDGNTTQGLKVWNSSLSGAAFNTFNSTVSPSLNADWLSALRDGVVDPSLVVIALGTNEAATTNTWIGGPSRVTAVESLLREMVDDVKAAYAIGFPNNPDPSFVFFVPPAAGFKGSADWQLIRDMYASVADEIGAVIWDWAGLTGDVNYEYASVGTLTAAIDNSAGTTNIPIFGSSLSRGPTNVEVGDVVTVDTESMTVTAVNAKSIDVTRGTPRSGHSKNARVFNRGIISGSGDPQAWTPDKVHPNTLGHRAIGDFVTARALGSVDALNTFIPNIPDGLIQGSQLADATITGTKMALETITSDNILDGSIYGQDIAADAAIDISKIDISTPIDGSNISIADGSIEPVKINGTAVVTTDSRLDSKVIAAGVGNSYNNSSSRTALVSTTLSNVVDGNIYRLRAWGVSINNTGVAMTIGLDLNLGPTGTSIMPTSGLSVGANIFPRHWFYDLEIYIVNASNSQLLNARMSFSGTNTLGSNSMSAALGSSFYLGNGDAATGQNLSGTPSLGLYATLGTASTNASINCLGYTLTKIS